VIETYRMLGEQRQADFEREAAGFRRAAQLPKRPRRLRTRWIGHRKSSARQVAVPSTPPIP
jgi:hypothetical protein